MRCVDYLVSEGVVKVAVMRLCLARTVVELRGRTDNYDSVDDVCMLLQLLARLCGSGEYGNV